MTVAKRTVIGLGALVLCAQGFSAATIARKGRVTTVASRCKGSSDPTLLTYNRRLVRTPKGRLLAVYDPHGRGQQLVWKDAGDGWRTKTRGDVTDGFFPQKLGGDRPATIALARSPNGRQHAWVVWGNRDFGHQLAVQGRRISELNDPEGPRVGRQFTIAKRNGAGNARPDLTFERGRRGKWRGVVSWLRRVSGGAYEMRVAWFTNLTTDTPAIHHRTSLFSSSRSTPTGDLITTSGGTKLVVVTPRGRFRIFTHGAAARLRNWRAGRSRLRVGRRSLPSAIRMRSGAVITAVESNPRDNVVKVVRFKAGRARVLLRLPRHAHPTVTRVGRGALVVMIRTRDGNVVSRRLRPRKGWTRRDRVELTGSNAAWPNSIAKSQRKLHFLVQGPMCPRNIPDQNGVLAYNRRV